MSDFSTFALFTAGLAVFATGASALDVVGGSNPTGPTLYTPSGVTAGKAMDLTWATAGADTCGKTVDLVLLKGPSSDKMAAISYIKQGAANSGSLSWTPDAALEPSATDYGVELVCADSKAYQYTARFGIANPAYKAGSSSSSSSSAAGGYGSSSTAAPSSYTTSAASGYGSSSSSSSSSSSTSSAKYPVGTATGGAGYGNGTEPKPTGSMTVPTTIQTSAAATTAAATTAVATGSSGSSSSAPASQTGAAGHVVAGFGGLAAAAAVAVYAL